jgi:hypothetical protein
MASLPHARALPACPLFALGLYLRIGQPGLPRAPFVARSPRPGRAPRRARRLAQAIATAARGSPSSRTIPTRSRRWARR